MNRTAAGSASADACQVVRSTTTDADARCPLPAARASIRADFREVSRKRRGSKNGRSRGSEDSSRPKSLIRIADRWNIPCAVSADACARPTGRLRSTAGVRRERSARLPRSRDAPCHRVPMIRGVMIWKPMRPWDAVLLVVFVRLNIIITEGPWGASDSRHGSTQRVRPSACA